MSLLLLFHGAGEAPPPGSEIGIGVSIDRPTRANLSTSGVIRAALGQSLVTDASMSPSAATRAALSPSVVTKASMSVELIED